MSQPQEDNLICELSPRKSAEIEKLVTSMNTSYDDLSGIQADTLSMDASDVCETQTFIYTYVTAASSLEDIVVVLRSFEQKKKQVLQLFTNISKQDVILNNCLCRSKTLALLFGVC